MYSTKLPDEALFCIHSSLPPGLFPIGNSMIPIRLNQVPLHYGWSAGLESCIITNIQQ